MADPIGAVRVVLAADSAAFERGLKRARGSLKTFGTHIRTGIAAVAKWSAAIAAAGIAIGTVFVRRAMKAIDALAKTSDRLGMTTEGLARLRHAAEQTGVATKTLDMGLQRMTRRIAEAAKGTGEAQDAIKQLGLNAKELSQMRPEEAFHVIADAMQNVESQGERVRLAFKLFDSEGVAIVNTLARGSEGLREMGDEADALGLSLSRIDAAQVEAANDAVDRAGKVIDGVINRITVHLAPYISAFADSMAEWSIEMKGFRDQIDSTFTFFVQSAATALNAVTVWVRAMRNVFASLTILGNIPVQIFRRVVNAMSGMLDFATSGINTLIKAANQFRSEPWDLIPAARESDAIQSLNRIADATQETMRDAVAAAPKTLGDFFNDLPGDRMMDWLDGIREKAEKTAKAVADATNGGGPTDDDDDSPNTPGGTSPSDIEEERALLEQRLEMLREHMMGEQELEIKRHEERLALLTEALENELLTKQEYQEMEAELKQQHEETLAKIEEDAAKRRIAIKDREEKEKKRIQDMEQRMQLQGYQNFASNAMAIGQSLFEDNKILAIAQALLSARRAIVEAYEWGSSIGGPPMGAAAAAAATAATMAQVAAVRSTKVGSSGTGAAGGGGGMGSTGDDGTGSGNNGQQQQQPINRTIHLNMVGDVFDQKTIRSIAEQINEFSDDGFRLTVRA